jgi:RimJ/RimL family protein N-acetyltransferase
VHVTRFPDTLCLRDGELELRRLVTSDRNALLRAFRDPEISRWTGIPDPFTGEAAEALLAEAESRWRDGQTAELAIVLDDRLVGGIHLTFYADWRASVAYWLAAEARGRGLATRAVRLLASWGFETFDDLVRIELWSIVGNDASDAVARRSGFSEEGIFRSRLPHGGEFRDVRCFSLLRGDPRG